MPRINFDDIDRKTAALAANMPPRVTMNGAQGTVSDVALERQAREAEVSRRAMAITGREWAMADPVFERGSRVNEIGVANFTAEGRELREAGPLVANLDATREVIRAERRRVVQVNVRDLRLVQRADGLHLGNKATGKALPASASVIDALCGYFPEVFGKVRAALTLTASEGGLDPDHKVEVFNRLTVDRLPGAIGNRSGELAAVLRYQHGAPTLWTLRGARNTANELDGADYLDLVREALAGVEDLYGTTHYDPESGRVVFNGWAMPNHIVDLSAGDVFKAGISGSTNDNKGGRYTVRFNVTRNLCHNLIILSHEGAEVFSATHNSRADRVVVGIRDGLARADSALDGFRELWGQLRSTQVPEQTEDRAEDVRAMLRDIAASVRQPGVDRDTTVEYLLGAWEAEPGYTMADIHNAVSRLHLQRDLDAYQVARTAGDLLPVLAQA